MDCVCNRNNNNWIIITWISKIRIKFLVTRIFNIILNSSLSFKITFIFASFIDINIHRNVAPATCMFLFRTTIFILIKIRCFTTVHVILIHRLYLFNINSRYTTILFSWCLTLLRAINRRRKRFIITLWYLKSLLIYLSFNTIFNRQHLTFRIDNFKWFSIIFKNLAFLITDLRPLILRIWSVSKIINDCLIFRHVVESIVIFSCIIDIAIIDTL